MEDILQRKIMIVGKESPELQRLESALLEDYVLSRVYESNEALLKMPEFKPDLILADEMLTDFERFCRRLLDMEEGKAIPLLSILEMFDEESALKALSFGVTDYIYKPFNLSLIRSRVRNYIELKLHRERQINNNRIDYLTQIPNRQRLLEVLHQEWERAKRNGTILSVLILDIDDFKRYNDAYGNNQGDLCLNKVAQTMNNLLKRPSDFVARWGSEEFACILPETDLNGALLIGENIRKEIYGLKIPHKMTSTDTAVTVSIGSASIRPTPNRDLEEIIRLAEKALDTAMNAGGNKLNAEIA